MLNRFGMLSVPALLWVGVWFGINTGPEVLLSYPEGAFQWATYARTVFPIIALYLITIVLLIKKDFIKNLPVNARFWLGYGVVGFIASVMSPSPLDALYWASLYLATFAVAKFYMSSSPGLSGLLGLNYLSWIAASLFFIALVTVSGGQLFSGSGAEMTGYGIEARVGDVAGMPMSRASGMSRFAAIPAIIGFVLFMMGSARLKLIGLAVFIACFIIIYAMQSRGAIVALAVTMIWVMFFGGKKVRIMAGGLLLMGVTIYLSGFFSDELGSIVLDHLSRGQDSDELASMTGRDRAWTNSLLAFEGSPLFGFGFQADRFLIGEHVHNTYMYALLSGGLIGLIFFALGMIWTWVMYFRLLLAGYVKEPLHKLFFIQAGALLLFFTIRGIPEVSGPLFGVDLMVMLPIMLYIGVLDRYKRMGRPLPFLFEKIEIGRKSL